MQDGQAPTPLEPQAPAIAETPAPETPLETAEEFVETALVSGPHQTEAPTGTIQSAEMDTLVTMPEKHDLDPLTAQELMELSSNPEAQQLISELREALAAVIEGQAATKLLADNLNKYADVLSKLDDLVDKQTKPTQPESALPQPGKAPDAPTSQTAPDSAQSASFSRFAQPIAPPATAEPSPDLLRVVEPSQAEAPAIDAQADVTAAVEEHLATESTTPVAPAEVAPSAAE